MMKPITAERRAEMRNLLRDTHAHGGLEYQSIGELFRTMVEELLAAEEYWRKTVGKRDPLGKCDYNGYSECFWCGARIPPWEITDEGGNAIQYHAPDCLWLVATAS